MKKSLYTLFLSITLFTVSSQTNTTYTIMSGGVARSYILYVPAIYNASLLTPLVFNFHGYGSNNSQQEFYGDFRGIADTANFIIAHPQGLSSGGSAGFSNFGTVASASGDINFTKDMIDTISAHFNINPCKIYSTGFSNGGFMSHDLACFLSSRFAAIASVSGSMMPNRVSACNPSHPIPIMQIHGTSDATVSYNGMGGSVASLHIDTLVKNWVKFNNCNLTPAFTTLPNTSTTDNCTAEHYVYSGGNANSTVEFYKIIGGGHSWPGASYNIPGINTNQDFKASKEIWRFFRKYCLTTLTNIVEVEKQHTVISVYPNPANTILNFSADNLNNVESIEITDVLGKVVLSDNANSNTVNIEKLQSGIYFLSIKDKYNTSGKAKFIKE